MQCNVHAENSASGVCARCGRGLCKICMKVGQTGQIVCSEECEIFLVEVSESLAVIRQKTLKQNKSAGDVYYFIGGLFILFGLFAFAVEGMWVVSVLTIPMGVGMLVAGASHRKIGNENKPGRAGQ